NDGTGPVRWISHARVKGRDEPCVHSIDEARFCRRGSNIATSLAVGTRPLQDQLGCTRCLPARSARRSAADLLSISRGPCRYARAGVSTPTPAAIRATGAAAATLFRATANLPVMGSR